MGPPRKTISRVELLILAQLRQGPAHGYAILSGLKEELGILLKSGTLYPALRRLSKRGLIKGKRVQQQVRPDAIEYSLTSQGEEVLSRVLRHMGGEMQMHDRFWGFLGSAVRGETASILFENMAHHRSPTGFAAMKHACCKSPNCMEERLEYLKEYRSYLENELKWVNQQLVEFSREEEEWEVKTK